MSGRTQAGGEADARVEVRPSGSVAVPAAARSGDQTLSSERHPLVVDGDTVDESKGLVAKVRRSALVRRIVGYSAGSIIAVFTSEIAFGGVYGWAHAGTTWASIAGYIGGAVPNYIFNRRWAWKDRNGRSRGMEIFLYGIVAVASLVASVAGTDAAEKWARHLSATHDMQVLLVAAAFLAVSGVFFVGKFVIFELIVFTKGPGEKADAPSPRAEDSTTS